MLSRSALLRTSVATLLVGNVPKSPIVTPARAQVAELGTMLLHITGSHWFQIFQAAAGVTASCWTIFNQFRATSNANASEPTLRQAASVLSSQPQLIVEMAKIPGMFRQELDQFAYRSLVANINAQIKTINSLVLGMPIGSARFDAVDQELRQIDERINQLETYDSILTFPVYASAASSHLALAREALAAGRAQASFVREAATRHATAVSRWLDDSRPGNPKFLISSLDKQQKEWNPYQGHRSIPIKETVFYSGNKSPEWAVELATLEVDFDVKGFKAILREKETYHFMNTPPWRYFFTSAPVNIYFNINQDKDRRDFADMVTTKEEFYSGDTDAKAFAAQVSDLTSRKIESILSTYRTQVASINQQNEKWDKLIVLQNAIQSSFDNFTNIRRIS